MKDVKYNEGDTKVAPLKSATHLKPSPIATLCFCLYCAFRKGVDDLAARLMRALKRYFGENIL